jgi:hypothetical protein
MVGLGVKCIRFPSVGPQGTGGVTKFSCKLQRRCLKAIGFLPVTDSVDQRIFCVFWNVKILAS